LNKEKKLYLDKKTGETYCSDCIETIYELTTNDAMLETHYGGFWLVDPDWDRMEEASKTKSLNEINQLEEIIKEKI
jgi:hypothetical protein